MVARVARRRMNSRAGEGSLDRVRGAFSADNIRRRPAGAPPRLHPPEAPVHDQLRIEQRIEQCACLYNHGQPPLHHPGAPVHDQFAWTVHPPASRCMISSAGARSCSASARALVQE